MESTPLIYTIEIAMQTKTMRRQELDHVNVDTTVQEKAVTFPTDAKLTNTMRKVRSLESKLQGKCPITGFIRLILQERLVMIYLIFL